MKWLLRILLLLPVLLLLLVGGVLLAANTDPGRRVLEGAVARLTGGQVRLEGLAGAFPHRLRLARLEVHDREGAWLLADDVRLDWSPLALRHMRVEAERLEVGRLAVLRAPVSEGEGGEASLPVQIAVAHLRVDRVELAPGLTALPAVLALGATGQVEIRTLEDATVRLAAEGLSAPGTLDLEGTMAPARLDAKVTYREPAGGLVAGVAGLPGLGAVTLEASAEGPWAALAVKLRVAAGALRADATATLDVPGERFRLELDGQAPEMALAEGVGWRSVAARLRAEGPFTAPKLDGTVRVEALAAGGATVGLLTVRAEGDAGRVGLEARAEAVRLPGAMPDLLAAAPVVLTAEARLDDPAYPTTLKLEHPLVEVAGNVSAGAVPQGRLEVTLPDLSPLVSQVAGRLQATLVGRVPATGAVVSAEGSVALARAPLPAFAGETVTFDIAAEQRGERVLIERKSFASPAARLAGSGAWSAEEVEATLSLVLPDLASLVPALSGEARIAATLRGPAQDLSLEAELEGRAGTEGFAPLPFTFALSASGLPEAPSARVQGHATLEGAPLALRAEGWMAPGGAMRLRVEEATWKSARLEAALDMAPGASLPTGRATLEVGRLEDAAPFAPGLSGSVKAEMRRNGGGELVARVEASGVGPVRTATLTAEGPPEAIVLALKADAMAALEADATLDAVGRSLVLSRLRASQDGVSATLQAPARIDFADGVAVDRLRLGLAPGGGVLDVAGRVAPALDVTATLRGLPVSLLAVVVGGQEADGTIEGEARLTGSAAAPQGGLRLGATGLRLREGVAASLPAASVTATANLAGARAQVEARASLGNASLSVAGGVPLGAGALDLRASGRASLALLDPILSAQGRSVRGDLVLDGTVTGPLSAPVPAGTLRLSRGEVRDAGSGLLIRDIAGLVRAGGGRVTVERLEGKAGNGTISVTGGAVLGPPVTLDLRLRANDARPVTSPLATAVFDADLGLNGEVGGAMRLGGTVTLERVEIRIPERLPVDLPTLPIRVAGEAEPPPATPVESAANIALDVTVRAPGNVYVRGRGLDAELSGEARITGTAAAPSPSGGLQLRRGTFNLLGRRLDLTEGSVSLPGGPNLSPMIDFTATSRTSTMTARVQVVGPASAPEIKLSSDPEMPADEVLSQLLLGRSIADLSPAQIAEIAVGLAQLTGKGGGFDPLGRIRAGLGLDRLSVGSNADGKGQVEAGRNLAPGVYLGVKQSTAGAGTQATVEIDIGRGMKLWGEVGTSAGGTSATGAAGGGGSGVGISWSKEY